MTGVTGCRDVPDDAHHLRGAQAALALLHPLCQAREPGAGARAEARGVSSL